MGVRLVVGHLAYVGWERRRQGDAYSFHLPAPDLAVTGRKGSILVVAGGSGEGGAGERTSRMAVDLIRERYLTSASDYPVEALRQAFVAANSAFVAEGVGHGGVTRSVATAVIRDGSLVVGSLGECRAYLWRGAQLVDLTGMALPEGAQARGGDEGEAFAETPALKVPSQVLGRAAQIDPEIRLVGQLDDGDRILLCTYGVYGALGSEQIGTALAGCEPQAACRRLVEMARAADGADSMAVLIAEVHAGAAEAVAEEPERRSRMRPADEKTLQKRERQLRKLQAVVNAQMQDLAERERTLQEAPAALGRELRAELAPLRAQIELLQRSQAEMRGQIAQLSEGYARLDLEIKQQGRQNALFQHGQEAAQAELASQRQDLLAWVHQLGEYEQGVRHWSERLRQVELGLQGEARPRHRGDRRSEPPAECLVEYLATGAGACKQQAHIRLADDRVVECGVTARQEAMRRQYPAALEVWAEEGGRRATRVLVGYGLDVRTMPMAVVQGRRLSVVSGGDEAAVLYLGQVKVIAVVVGCEFATVAQHKVSRDGVAFRSLTVRFIVIWEG